MGLLSLLGGIGSIIGNFLGLKRVQGEVIDSSIKVIQNLADGDAKAHVAQVAAISQILTQGSPIERLWRPLLMCVLCGILVSFWFGYAPPEIDKPLSPMMAQILELIKFGLGGYMGLRSVDKLIQQVNLAGVLKALIRSKLSIDPDQGKVIQEPSPPDRRRYNDKQSY